jgi:hypothetical protein
MPKEREGLARAQAEVVKMVLVETAQNMSQNSYLAGRKLKGFRKG